MEKWWEERSDHRRYDNGGDTANERVRRNWVSYYGVQSTEYLSTLSYYYGNCTGYDRSTGPPVAPMRMRTPLN